MPGKRVFKKKNIFLEVYYAYWKHLWCLFLWEWEMLKKLFRRMSSLSQSTCMFYSKNNLFILMSFGQTIWVARREGNQQILSPHRQILDRDIWIYKSFSTKQTQWTGECNAEKIFKAPCDYYIT